MDLERFLNDEFQRLQVWNRSVRLENPQTLMRRWRLVQTGAMDGVRCTEHLLPGQRNLLDFLAVAAPAEVQRIADCAIPLFGVNLPHTDCVLAHYAEPADALQLESALGQFNYTSACATERRTTAGAQLPTASCSAGN